MRFSSTYNYSISAATHIGGRSVNQDRVLLPNNEILASNKARDMLCKIHSFFAVADGAGSLHESGMIAEETLSQIRYLVSEVIYNSKPEVDSKSPMSNDARVMQLNLRRCVYETNEYLLKKYDYKIPGASTLSLLCVEDDYYHLVNVGDSPILLYRNGILMRLSKIDTLAELKREKGIQNITDVDNRTLSEYIGRLDLKLTSIHCTSIQHECGDVIIVASDGLTDTLSMEQIVDAIEARSSASSLVKQCVREDPGCDNISIVLAYFP